REPEVRQGRAGQALRGPRSRPLSGDRRADADAEGEAQRRLRQIFRALRLALQAVGEAAGRDPRPPLLETSYFDITDGRPGLPLSLSITVVHARSCKPISG